MVRHKSLFFVITIFTLLFTLILLLTTTPSSASTITVDDSGGADYETIKDAMNAAKDGDTIRVYEGHYKENLVITKSLTIIGNGSKNTTIFLKNTSHTHSSSASNSCSPTGTPSSPAVSNP